MDLFSEGLKWNLIRNALIRNLGVEVSADEVKGVFMDRVRQYFGGNAPDSEVEKTAMMLMQKREQVDQVYEEMMSEQTI